MRLIIADRERASSAPPIYPTNPLVADTDGDGWSDGAEHEFSGDPTSAARTPKFEFRIAIEPSSGDVKLSLPGTPGTSYAIEASDNLADWQTLESGIQGAGDVVRRSVPKAEHLQRYFRLKIN